MEVAPLIEHIYLGISVLLILAILSSNLSSRIGIPALIFFLGIGMLAGSDGLGGIYFDNPYLAQLLGSAALIFILYSGALQTDWGHIKPVAKSAASLASLGVILTASLVAVFVYYVLHFTLIESLLFGSIVSSTDAAAVFSVLRSKSIRLKQNIQTVIEVESASNDPAAILLVLVFVQLLTANDMTMWKLIFMLTCQILIGIGMGWLMGRLIPIIINRTNLEHKGLYPVLMIGLVLLTFSLTTVIEGNGYLAVYLAGLLTGQKKFQFKKELIEFHEGLTWLMQIAMFITLGLLVFPSQLISNAWTDVGAALFLIFIARPISIFLSLALSNFKVKEKVMISWVGLRGAVPIILATYPLLANVPKADIMFNLVFFIVLLSVAIQGTLLPHMASLLKINK